MADLRLTRDQRRKANFLREVWNWLVNEESVPIYYYLGLLPEALESRFPRGVRRADLIELLDDPTLVEDCFETARTRIVDTWEDLEPAAASAIVGSIEQLWSNFDRDTIRLSEVSRQILRVRFDLADMIYEHRERLIEHTWLERSGGITKVLFITQAFYNMEKVLAAYSELVMDHSRIDLACVNLARVPETAALMAHVKRRLKKAYRDKLGFLRTLVKASTDWRRHVLRGSFRHRRRPAQGVSRRDRDRRLRSCARRQGNRLCMTSVGRHSLSPLRGDVARHPFCSWARSATRNTDQQGAWSSLTPQQTSTRLRIQSKRHSSPSKLLTIPVGVYNLSVVKAPRIRLCKCFNQ